jgi:hypothetical protein
MLSNSVFGQSFDKLLGDPLAPIGRMLFARGTRARINVSNPRIRVRFTLTFQIAESMGFKGEFRQWEHLLRIAE